MVSRRLDGATRIISAGRFKFVRYLSDRLMVNIICSDVPLRIHNSVAPIKKFYTSESCGYSGDKAVDMV